MPADSGAFASYGLPGLVIASLFALVVFLVKEHQSERREWIEAYREGNEVMRELVTVVRVSSERSRRTD